MLPLKQTDNGREAIILKKMCRRRNNHIRLLGTFARGMRSAHIWSSIRRMIWLGRAETKLQSHVVGYAGI